MALSGRLSLTCGSSCCNRHICLLTCQTQFGFTVSRDDDAPVGDGSKPRDVGMMGDMMEKLKGLMSANPLPNPEYASQHVKTRDAHPKGACHTVLRALGVAMGRAL